MSGSRGESERGDGGAGGGAGGGAAGRGDARPVLFVTGHAPRDRVGAFAELHRREGIELALFGGHSLHGPDVSPSLYGSEEVQASHGPPVLPSLYGPEEEPQPSQDPPVSPSSYGPQQRQSSHSQRVSPSLYDAQESQASQGPGVLPSSYSPQEESQAPELSLPERAVAARALGALAASGRYRAVICSTGGRLALPAAWAGARRARVPLILWSSLWAHPRTVAHAFSYVALLRLYRSADALVTYGPHVSAYVRARGARNVHVAPQAVDNAFWSAPGTSPPPRPWPTEATVKFLFAGRPGREKGLRVLIEAWRRSGLGAPSAALVLVGVGPVPPWVPADGAVRRNLTALDPVPAERLRDIYASADVLVVPSIPTRTFREPWGLVVNEAMNRSLPVIASDAVGAAAGGLVRDGRNGLVTPAGDPAALARALRRLAADAPLRARLGAAGASDVRGYTYEAWAEGFTSALRSVGVSRERRW